jgi:hypothetical protein
MTVMLKIQIIIIIIILKNPNSFFGIFNLALVGNQDKK